MEKGKDLRSFLTIKFNDHVLVDEKKPFVLYCISVMTMFSKINIVKRYSSFQELSLELSKFSKDEIMMKNGRKEIVSNLLPSFPDSSMYYWNLDDEFIQGRKVELEQYSQSVVDLFCKLTIMGKKSQENAYEIPDIYSKSKTLLKFLLSYGALAITAVL